MVRDEGMKISISYANDGHWRVRTSDNSSDHQGYAQTKKANLNRPYGRKCEWEVKLNMPRDVGMEPAPELKVIALNEAETTFRKVCAILTSALFVFL